MRPIARRVFPSDFASLCSPRWPAVPAPGMVPVHELQYKKRKPKAKTQCPHSGEASFQRSGKQCTAPEARDSLHAILSHPHAVRSPVRCRDSGPGGDAAPHLGADDGHTEVEARLQFPRSEEGTKGPRDPSPVSIERFKALLAWATRGGSWLRNRLFRT